MTLQANDIQVGRVYSAKRPTVNGWLEPLINDRSVRWIDSGKTLVQYDGPSVARGRKFPVVAMEKFLSWARADVTDLCPAGQWRAPSAAAPAIAVAAAPEAPEAALGAGPSTEGIQEGASA